MHIREELYENQIEIKRLDRTALSLSLNVTTRLEINKFNEF